MCSIPPITINSPTKKAMVDHWTSDIISSGSALLSISIKIAPVIATASLPIPVKSWIRKKMTIRLRIIIDLLKSFWLLISFFSSSCINFFFSSLVILCSNSFLKTILKKIIDETPLRKICTPRDVAESAMFLASEEAEFITGIVLPVDGGRSL